MRLSEDAACNRIEAARACRRFPQILDLLDSGALSLTSVRLLGRHLTVDNHEAVLAQAVGMTRREIEVLIAELAPRPDVPGLIRKLPSRAARAAPVVALVPTEVAAGTGTAPTTRPPASTPRLAPRPVVEPLAPERYRVQFTIGRETQEKLRRLQDLLRREIPSGDPGVIFDRAMSELLEKVERRKLGKAVRPRPAIRPGTDRPAAAHADAAEGALATRDPTNAVKRDVWARDGGRCGYVAPDGRRCTQGAFIEFHHDQPYAMRGEPTVENIALRCRLHNQYEAFVMSGESRAPIRAAGGPAVCSSVSGFHALSRRSRAASDGRSAG